MDLYEILQVSQRADIEVIRAAYRVLARRYHPDVGGDVRRMAAVNDAWATLSDPLKRRRYDATFGKAHPAPTVSTDPTTNGFGVMNRRPEPRPSAPASSARPDPRAPRPGEPAQAAGGPRPAPAPAQSGRPPFATASTVIDFGRYAGWSVSDLSRHDPDYLLWLERAPIGRHLQSEIQRVMELRRGAAASLASRQPAPAVRRNAGGWFR